MGSGHVVYSQKNRQEGKANHAENPKIFAPAMNTRMYQNPIVQDNMKILENYGMEVVTPALGYLACGDTGEGKMPEPEVLFESIVKALAPRICQGSRFW